MDDRYLEIKTLRGRDAAPEQLRTQSAETDASVERAVAEIIADVRNRGDAAVRDYTLRFDGVELDSLTVSRGEIDEAREAVTREKPELIEALAIAERNIRGYHIKQIRHGYIAASEDGGVITGQRVAPLERVGVYVPGGTAVYPSSVLMNAIPAKLAGVPDLCLASPPQGDGKCDPVILAAAGLAGVDRVYKMGGAQAIAAFAFGTESVGRVDKVTGPGNVYVQAAKRQLYGIIDIEMLAGPSEIMIIADGGANERHIAADMLAQTEHDVMAAAVLVVTDERLAARVRDELVRRLRSLPRGEIARQSLCANGRIVVAESLRQAVDICNRFAPEHLEICVREPFAVLGEIRHAGSVFLGDYTPVALGDYIAGPNHTLPTGGAARFASPLSVDDFVKKSSFTYYTKEALARDAAAAAIFARQESFEAHAQSVEVRFS